MNRQETLDAASQTVIDREATHGNPRENFQLIADLWGFYLNTHIDAKDVAALMVLLKISRSRLGHTDDHAVDICGYAALMNELV